MSATELYVAATTDDGKVHESIFEIGAAWRPFKPITSLNGATKNQNVSVDSPYRVATVDDSIPIELRSSFKTRAAWTPALKIATGIWMTRANKYPIGAMELLGVGAAETPGWSFGLPMFWVQASGTKADRKGDAAARLDLGDLDPADLPVSFDFAGTLGSGGFFRGFFLCLATQMGGIYFADIPPTGKGRLTDLKATAAGDPGKVIGVACAGSEVCVVNDAGKIWHTSRRPDGTWLPFYDVSAAAGSTEDFRQISVLVTEEFGRSRTRLHLLGVTTSGGLFHTFRPLNVSPAPWSPFVDVKAKASDPGHVTYADLAANNVID